MTTEKAQPKDPRRWISRPTLITRMEAHKESLIDRPNHDASGESVKSNIFDAHVPKALLTPRNHGRAQNRSWQRPLVEPRSGCRFNTWVTQMVRT